MSHVPAKSSRLDVLMSVSAVLLFSLGSAVEVPAPLFGTVCRAGVVVPATKPYRAATHQPGFGAESDLLLNWGWPGQEPPVRPSFYPKRRFGERTLGRCFLARETSAFGRQDWHSSTQKMQPGAPDEQSNSDPGTTKVRPKKRFSVMIFLLFLVLL